MSFHVSSLAVPPVGSPLCVSPVSCYQLRPDVLHLRPVLPTLPVYLSLSSHCQIVLRRLLTSLVIFLAFEFLLFGIQDLRV